MGAKIQKSWLSSNTKKYYLSSSDYNKLSEFYPIVYMFFLSLLKNNKK